MTFQASLFFNFPVFYFEFHNCQNSPKNKSMKKKKSDISISFVGQSLRALHIPKLKI